MVGFMGQRSGFGGEVPRVQSGAEAVFLLWSAAEETASMAAMTAFEVMEFRNCRISIAEPRRLPRWGLGALRFSLTRVLWRREVEAHMVDQEEGNHVPGHARQKPVVRRAARVEVADESWSFGPLRRDQAWKSVWTSVDQVIWLGWQSQMSRL